VSRGQILIDGVDIRDLALEDVRAMCSLELQYKDRAKEEEAVK
jgi:ABC-type multidrug transport system fused ATPase/permease subunit